MRKPITQARKTKGRGKKKEDLSFLQQSIKTEKSFSQVLWLFLLGVSGLLILSHFFSIFSGYYYTGDTISSFEPTIIGKPGNLFIVFRNYYAVWPPGVGFVFSLLRALPISIISAHQVYVVLISFLTFSVAYLLTSHLTKSIALRVIIVSLVLLGGAQEFLLKVAISEPLFIFFWLLIILALERFFSTLRERYLLLFLIAAGGMTLSRYSGISILASLILILAVFIFKTRRQKKYSLLLAGLVSVFSWVPIGIYLLRNRILNDKLLGLHDTQFPHITFVDIFKDLTPNITGDLAVLLPVSILIGIAVTWGKSVKSILIISGISAITYIVFLYFSFLNYRVQSGFHSRLPGISYPFLVLSGIMLGSFLGDRFIRLKQFAVLGVIAGIILLVTQSYIILQRSINEGSQDRSLVVGTEYSGDIRKLCRGKTPNKYLLIQESSRNWTGQSLRFYCQPIEIMPVYELPRELPLNSLIYSAYNLAGLGLKEEVFYQGEKNIYIYSTDEASVLQKNELLNKLEPLD